MAEFVTPVQTKRLRRQRTPAEYRLYRAALEWGLVDPIVIASERHFKSEPRWRGQIEPSPHHLSNVMMFCQQIPAVLLADEAGLDNSVSAGLLASELIARGRAAKLLIVCPKILAGEWRHLLETKFRIPAQIVLGRDLMFTEPAEIGAVITTYHSAWQYLDQIPNDRFELLVLDEVDKLRHLQRSLHGVDQPAHIPGVFRDALERRRFRYVLMMTARPILQRPVGYLLSDRFIDRSTRPHQPVRQRKCICVKVHRRQARRGPCAQAASTGRIPCHHVAVYNAHPPRRCKTKFPRSHCALAPGRAKSERA